MVRATIDGRPLELPGSVTVLAALERAGIHVPRLCHDDRIAPVGACRLCLVRVQGVARPVASCVTLLADGMVIDTHTPALEDERRTLLAMLASRQPSDVAADGIETPFLRELRAYGLTSALTGKADPTLVDDRIRTSTSTCPGASTASRACGSATRCRDSSPGRSSDRGERHALVPDSGTTLLDSSCVSCGACVDACPTGALEDKSRPRRGVGPTAVDPHDLPLLRRRMRAAGRHAQRAHRRRSVPPSTHPSTRATSASKGRYAFGFVSAPDRITTPMIRDGRRVAIGVLGRGDAPRGRTSARDRRRSTARSASACSARRAPRTRTTTSPRSSPASCSEPTTSTAARASATRRAPRR